MKRGIVLILAAIFLGLAGMSWAGSFKSSGLLVAPQAYEPGQVLVKLKNTAEPFSKIKLPENLTVPQALKILKQNPQIEIAEPNYYAWAFFVPNDPYYKYQWHFPKINLEPAWDISQGKDVVVAVIDTGIAYENQGRFKKAPDLDQTSFVPGYDFVGDDPHPNDDNGHGTHVAGTIAQSTNNSLGVVGVAFKAFLMPIKVLDKYGRGTYADVAKGIYWAADHGANIINLSLGGDFPSQILEQAVKYAYEKGVSIIAASGNSGKTQVSYPAAYDDYVIAVGATRFDNTKASYSNWGPSLDLVAPGGDLTRDQNNDGFADGVLQQTFSWSPRRFSYYFFQGTSMASPHVAGVAALVEALGIKEPAQVRKILQDSAQDLGQTGWDPQYGWGLVDAREALKQAQALLAESPSTKTEPDLFEPEPEPVSDRAPALIEINEIQARDTQPGRIYYVKAYIQNLGSDKFQGRAGLNLYSPQEDLVSWTDSKKVDLLIKPDNIVKVRFWGRVSKQAVPGQYQAEVVVEDLAGQKIASQSQEFSISAAWRGFFQESLPSLSPKFSPKDFLDFKLKPINLNILDIKELPLK